MGKVPLLLIRENPGAQPVVLFESAPINEYVDEISPPMLSPADPLEKARERAWIAVSGELLMSLHTVMMSKEFGEATEARNEIWDVLARVEETLTGNPFFSTRGFSLVDAAFAPVFMRIFLMRSLREDSHWKSLPKILRWANALQKLPEVRDSVVADFKNRYVELLTRHESPAVKEMV